MVIRKTTNDDIDDIVKLLHLVLKVHHKIRKDLFKEDGSKFSHKEIEDIIKDDNTPVFVCEENNKVIGYLFAKIIITKDNPITPDIKRFHIEDLCVDEMNQNKHVGTKLMEYAFEYAKKIGCYNVTLDVWEGNDRAIEFYKKQGLKTYKYRMEKIL